MTEETPIYPFRYCRPLLVAVRKHYSERSYGMIGQALRIAVEQLSGLTRYNGEPFVTHSINTALIVSEEIGLGRNSVIATLLHDVLRLKKMEMEQVEELFGPECVTILRGLNQISDIDPKKSEEQVDNFRELILSYATDPRVILIKLADRLEVMRTLGSFPVEKQEQKAWETLHLYAEIAHKLGLYAVKSELEDLALKYLHPDEYNYIVQKLSETDAERRAFIRRFVAPIEEKMQQQGIRYTLKSRTKSIYSIWRKMKKDNLAFDEVYDVFALRFILDTPRELEKQTAWTVYSIVTDFYTPNPARMRDWITFPKSNGYESLHATVVTKEGKWVEVQIRTERMDEVAERGVAAHWRYKGVTQGGMSSEMWLAKLRELMETAENAVNISQKIEAPDVSDEVFVFTPNGDLRKLRAGATVLDFAFDIHSRIGSTCTGARINDRIVSIREKLKNGDVVEIITSKNQKPKADWLNIVVTSKAKQRIKAYLREEQAKAANLGRETLERKLKNWKVTTSIDDAVNLLCKRYKVKTGTEVYGMIADGKASLTEIKEIVTGAAPAPEEKKRGEVRARKAESNDESLIIDDTLRQVSYKFGKCCNPIFGDEVFGFVTVSAGITIHRNDCPNGCRLKERYPYRVLEARWRDDAHTGSFRATVRLIAEDTVGLLNRITEVITRELKINIRSMSLIPTSGQIEGTINIEVTSTQMVDSVIHALLRIKGIQKVYRVNK
ncbi:MAG: RelA/SpoT family protein [Rikenellaceae bacterium]|jgi:GTP pyrophosphokinase|nr:RelA/SpoT family protein [Rikenellaceae bacterium]